MNKTIFYSISLLLLLIVLPFKFAQALTFSPPRFEIQGDPGQIVEKEMTLINEGTDPQTFYSVFRNFEAEGETGVPSPTDSDTGLASWLRTEKQITLAPKSSQQVAFQVFIPQDATPGGYFAMVLWSTTSPEAVPGQVAIGAQTGPLVLLTVNGAIKESGGIKEFSTKNNQKFYLSLPVDFYFKFRNDGGDRIKPIGDIKIKNIFGLGGTTIAANRVEGNILPNGTRKFETEWKGKGDKAESEMSKADPKTLGFFENVKNEWRNFAFGHYTATLSLTYGATTKAAESTVAFWIFPWQLLLVIVIALILFYFIIKHLIRSYNRFIIGQATMALEKMEEKKGEEGKRRERVVKDESSSEGTLNLRSTKRPRKM